MADFFASPEEALAASRRQPPPQFFASPEAALAAQPAAPAAPTQFFASPEAALAAQSPATAPPAQTPLSSIYTPTTGAPGAEKLSNLFPTAVTGAAPEGMVNQLPPPGPPGLSFIVDPMSGVPLATASVPSLAQTVTTDRDLEGQRAAAMADPVSLGERFALNATDAYYGGTLAGSGQLVELQRAAKMSPQEWAEYNAAVRYSGGALRPLPSPEAAQAEIARLTAARTRYETIPWSSGPGELAVAVGGQLAGGVLTPESGINRVPGVAQGIGAISRAAPVIGRTVERGIGETGQAVAGRMLESGLSQGVVNTAIDPLAQVGVVATGVQPEGYDPMRTALAFPLGVGLGAGLHGATEAVGAGVRSLPPRVPNIPPLPPAVVDRAAVEALRPAGQQYTTERPNVTLSVPPRPEGVASIGPVEGGPTRTEIAPEQFPPTAAAPPAAEPYTRTVEPPPQTTPVPPPPPEPLPPLPTGEPVDRPGAAAGRPEGAAPVGEAGGAGVVPGPGEIPGGARLGTGPGERPPDLAGARGGEQPAAQPALPAGEARPTVGAEPPARQAPTPAATEAAPVGRLTTEPDHTVPGQHVAKNPAGEVVGKGASPEAAQADAQARQNAPYAPEAPAKRPVTKAELEALDKRARDTGYAAERASRDPKTTPERLDTLRQRAEEARAARAAAEGPPGRPLYKVGLSAKEMTAEHERLTSEHGAAIDRRVHAEGTDPKPEITVSAVGKVFGMTGSTGLARGQDAAGNGWTGTGNVILKNTPVMERAAAQEAKKARNIDRPIRPEALIKITTPDPKGDYQPVTWERQVTTPDGPTVVIGTKPDGTRVVVQKPVFDALHAAAGEKGVILADTRTIKGKDDRLFVRAPSGQDIGVGMPMNVRQEQMRIWARGPERPAAAADQVEAPAARLEDQAVVLPEAGRAPGPREDAGTTGPREAVSETGPGLSTERPTARTEPPTQLEKLTATRDALVAKPNKTLADRIKTNSLNTQIEKLSRRLDERTAQERRAGRKEPITGPPRPKVEQGFPDYKYNNGVSVWRDVFSQAGHDPDLATSLPVKKQNEILTQHMIDTFGFRDVSLAPESFAVDEFIARNAMLDATRAIQDLMASLGLPHSAASLNGRLKLVINPEREAGRGRYGAYEPGSGEIRLSGRANSFGHEWTHAVDHLLAERATGTPGLTNNLLTKYAQADRLDPKDGVQGAFAKVLNAIYYDKAAQALREIDLINQSNRVDKNGAPTAGAVEAQRKLDMLERGNLRLRIQSSEFREQARQYGTNPAYYTDPVELLARAHESYLARQMKNAGVDPRGAVMPDEAYLKETERTLKMLYPKDEDQAAIFRAFDDLHHELRKADILSEGKPAGAFPNLGLADPTHYPPNLARQPAAKIVTRETNRWAARTRAILNEQLFDTNRPPPPAHIGWSQNVADFGRSLTYSDGGLMNVVIDRVPAGAKPALQELRDLATTDPGSGRYTPEFLQEKSRFQEDSWMRRYTNIIQSGGYNHPRRMPAEENEMIRHALTSGENAYPPDPNKPSVTKPIPPHLVKIVGQLRSLLDEVWQTVHNSGIDIGYAKNGFFPRNYDKRTIFHDQDGFVRQATKLHALMFDQELGRPGSDPQALLEKWGSLSREYKAGADPELGTKMTELNRNLRQQRVIEENPAPTPAKTAELKQLKIDAETLASEAHPLFRDHFSAKESDAWHARITNPELRGFDSEGISGRHFNARTLPAEADLIMRDYMYRDIHDAIPQYFEAASRRTADAERFGVQGERVVELMEAARRGGAHPDDLKMFSESLKRVRGVDQPEQNTHVVQFTKYGHAFGAVTMMPRAMWSSIAEPINGGLVTGSTTFGGRVIINQFAHAFGRLFRTASAHERTQFVELVGVMHSAQHDAIMNARMGSDYSNSPRLAKFMGGFFRLSGLTQLTNWQRAATAAAGHWFLTKLAKSYENSADGFGARFGRDKAIRWFNEMGVPPELHDGFAKWLTDLDGDRPTVARLLSDDMAPVYGLAIRRLTNRVIQNPFQVDRAAMSGAPVLGLAFQMMSFNYAYSKNVLEPAFGSVARGYRFTKEDALAGGASAGTAQARALAAAAPRAIGTAAGVGVKMAANAGVLIGAGFMVNAVREVIFSPDKWEEHEKAGDLGTWLLNLTMQRSGFNGTLDPLIQVATNLRYMGDIQSLVGGASVAGFTKGLMDLLAPLTAGDGDTNASMYRSVRAGINMAGVPLAAWGLNAIGERGGPVARVVAGATLQKLTSSETVSRLTERITGKKGAKAADTGSGKLSELGGLSSLEGLTELGAEPKEGVDKRAKIGAGTTPWAPVWTLADDVILPAARAVGPAVASLPGPVKIGAAAVGAALGARQVWQEGAPFRGQPSPAERAAAR